jgi:hypothetical protein
MNESFIGCTTTQSLRTEKRCARKTTCTPYENQLFGYVFVFSDAYRKGKMFTHAADTQQLHIYRRSTFSKSPRLIPTKLNKPAQGCGVVFLPMPRKVKLAWEALLHG